MQKIQDYIELLKPVFNGDIRFDTITRKLYSTDASIYQIEPMGVLLPKDQESLIAAVELAAQYKLPLLPRGSGSSLAGQAVGDAIILDTSKYLNRIISPVNPETREVTVEPGVILARVNREAARYGLMFGPDPASAERATIGGVIGNNATGAHSIRYGMTADHIVSADTVLADGSLATWGEVTSGGVTHNAMFDQVIGLARKIRVKGAEDIQKGWPKTWRNSTGYRLNYLLPWSATRPPQWEGAEYPRRIADGGIDLAPLLAGSEGTLAIIRRATLRLVPKPRITQLAILEYKNVIAACEDVVRILRLAPAAVELIPQDLVHLAKSVPAFAANARFFNDSAGAFLAVEFSGNEKADLENLGRTGPNTITVAETAADQEAIWATRKVGLGLFDSASKATRPIAFIEDCAIPVENLGEFVRHLEAIFSQHGVTATYYAHASAGCLHVRPMIDLRVNSGRESLLSISRATFQLTMGLGGSMSSEHGDGIVRGQWIRETVGEDAYQWMVQLKKTADPENRLNPGKIIDTPPILSYFRNDGKKPIQIWNTNVDFSETNGLLPAIERCNGQGVCRKEGGVMCPSYQVTKDEVFSTRGRANLLREFVYGDPSELRIRDLKETFDLCLACKGCKAECPSKVDMAKLKIAFMERYYKSHPHSLRDHIFAHLPTLVRAFSGMPWLYNYAIDLFASSPAILAKIGISNAHPLPRILSSAKWTENSASTDVKKQKVIFLSDTYTRFFEPEIEQAAVEVLGRAGYEILMPVSIGAGRTYLSKGFLAYAKKHLAGLVDQLQRLDPDGSLQVVCLEPSELSVLRDELPALIPGQKSRSIASRSYSLEEFLLRNSKLESKSAKSKKVLFHAHCHQKTTSPADDGIAMGPEATIEILRKFGYQPELINSGCCGMAGSFGYELEHAQISRQAAEIALFPAIRAEEEISDTIICTTGTSCRTQIGSGLGKASYHPAVLIRQAMVIQD